MSKRPEYDKEEAFRWKINSLRTLSLLRRKGQKDILVLTGSENLLSDLKLTELAETLLEIDKWLKENK